MASTPIKLNVYSQRTTPQGPGMPSMRAPDLGQGAAPRLADIGRALRESQDVDLQIERLRLAREEDDARAHVSRAVAEYRSRANHISNEVFSSAPDGWRGATTQFEAAANLLRQEYQAAAEAASPSAGQLFRQTADTLMPELFDRVAAREQDQRESWQFDTYSQAAETNAGMIAADDSLYEPLLAESMASYAGMSNAEQRRRLEGATQSSFAGAAVGGMIERNPSAALRALRDPQAQGPIAHLGAARGRYIEQAQNEIERRQSLYRSTLRDRLEFERMALDSGVAVEGGTTSVETVRAAFGDNAARAWDVQLRTAEVARQAQNASVDELMAMRAAPEDRSSIEAHAQWEAGVHASERMLTEMARDPMGMLVRQGRVGETPDLNDALTAYMQNSVTGPHGSGSALTAFLRRRAAAATEAANTRGVPPAVFTESEASGLAATLRSMPSPQQAQLLSRMRVAIGNDEVYNAAVEQITPGGGASRVAGGFIGRSGGDEVAGRILEGQAVIAGVQGPEGERRQAFNLPSDTDMRSEWTRATGNAFAGQPQADAAAYAAYQALYAAEASRAGRFGGDFQSSIARTAAQQIANTRTWRGSNRVLMPPGVNADVFKTEIDEAFARTGLPGRAMDYDLRPLGSGAYGLYHGDLPALTPDGAPAIVSVGR